MGWIRVVVKSIMVGQEMVVSSKMVAVQRIVMVEEVSMNWIDNLSVTEMDRRGVYGMDKRIKCQNKWKCH